MYAAIRQAKAKAGTAEELARRIKEGAIPIISDVEGFRAYYVVYAGDDTVTAISLFNNFEGAEGEVAGLLQISGRRVRLRPGSGQDPGRLEHGARPGSAGRRYRDPAGRPGAELSRAAG